MRILFICPSQEPETCGVGDYTRLLAHACEGQGHECGIVSLNDLGGQGTTERKGDLPIWRFRADSAFSFKAEGLVRIVGDFQPDWISLQFSPYGFNPKGLCWSLVDAVARATQGIRKHVFFHELFLGLHKEESLKNRVWGDLQRRIILRMLSRLSPDCIHSHAAPYLAWLRKQYPQVKELRLFGNIPLAGSVGPVAPQFDLIFDQKKNSNDRPLLGGYFGSFYPGAAHEGFASSLRRFSVSTGRQICCFLAGRQNPEARERWSALEKLSDEAIRWIYLGELAPGAVSRYLQRLDFGIAGTPWALAGKSGGVAAMQEHGLPVLVPRNDWTPRFIVDESFQDGLFPAWGEVPLSEAGFPGKKLDWKWGQESCAMQFLSDLEPASSSLSRSNLHN